MIIREREVSTPIASAITMPPFSARIARPVRLSSRLLVARHASATPAQIAVKLNRPSVSRTPATSSGGMPVIPSLRPKKSRFANT